MICTNTYEKWYINKNFSRYCHRTDQSSDFYYFRVLCIFVYLLTINFVRVLIVYFQNIVYSCITINFTISYVKIAHIYYIPCTCNYNIYFCYFILICMYLCCLFHIFKCEYRYSIIWGPWPKFLREGEGAKLGHENFVNNLYNL